MSRAHRPLRRVRGRDREVLVAGLVAAVGPTRSPLDVLVRSGRYGGDWWASLCARALRTRPAIVRRCLLGRVVSARAAGRILEAAVACIPTSTRCT